MTLDGLASSTTAGFQCEKCQSEITYAEKIVTNEPWHVVCYGCYKLFLDFRDKLVREFLGQT